MKKINQQTKSTNLLVLLASLIIVIAGIKLSKQIIVPFILASFFAIILAAPMQWLQEKGLTKSLSLIGVMAISMAFLAVIIMTVGGSIGEFEQQLPHYEKKFNQLWLNIGSHFNINMETAKSLFDPNKAIAYFSSFLTGLSALFTQTFLIVFIVIFMLLETSSFDKKIATISDEAKSITVKIVASIRGYLSIKSIFCLMTGVSVWLLALALKVPFPELWGLLAGLLNYIPNIGSIIAAVPAIIFALLSGGLQDAAIFTTGIIIINLLVGNVLEPKYMGKGLGLSVLVVFLSLTFWGWVLGPVGMLLSVPLTMILKLLLESKPETHFLAILLSSND